ncbi:MAG TPA: sigma-70 family RNA polymerase sigma factor [Syntrophomonadaceae bacterium]|nr:sigma-70 family RNA polymerase sigma factor [Syntrophomonadaceae bacterium]
MKKRPGNNRPASGTVDVRLLVRQAQAGDVKAFEELVVLYQDKVYNLSYYLAGNYADAQDLAQEVFVKAYTSLGSFRQDADLGTWLHRITVNLWLNIRRRQKNSQVFSLDDPVQTGEGEITRTVAAVDPAGDPVEALEGKELQEKVQKALLSLPEEFRTVLVLREIEDYSYDDIAEVMQCSLGTVKSRLNRARQALKEKIRSM